MDWKEALIVLRKIEGTTEAIAPLETEITRLTNANFELVKDARTLTNKNRDAEAKLTDLLQTLGAEGEDFKAKTDSANSLVKTLQTDLVQVTKDKEELDKKYTALETETTTLKRRTLIQDAAGKIGAVPDVLSTLLKDIPIERLSIDNEKVAIASEDGKSKTELKEYASSQWAAFVPALFPSTPAPAPATPKLPSGTPTSESAEENPLKIYRTGTYDRTVDKIKSSVKT